jgi:RNA polymerase sigma-70 factor (ECF subfamily)
MLGSVMEAEDMVQEAYVRYQAFAPEQVQTPKAFLSTIVTRLCLDQLKSARVQREAYIGPWLPEPVLTEAAIPEPANEIEAHESISMAFLVLLESLTPVERAVFLLREVFDYEYQEIAQIVGKEEAACRQLFSRAKKHIRENRPRFTSTPDEHLRLMGEFMQAVGAGDLEGLKQLLSNQVTLWSDGGGKVQAARKPLHGRDLVARFMLNILKRAPQGMLTEPISVNDTLGLMVRSADGRPLVVVTMEVDEGQVQALRLVSNPDKLKHL